MDNIFSELGFNKEEALKHEMKFYLMENIRKFIEREGLSQAKAAEFFGTTQPKISNLMRGNPSAYTIDRMVAMTARTGGKWSYSFKQPRKGVTQREAA